MPVRIFGFPYPLLGNLLHLPLAGFPALQQAVEIRLIGQVGLSRLLERRVDGALASLRKAHPCTVSFSACEVLCSIC